MGGEPTFVSIDDMEGAEWNTAAFGPTKRHLAAALLKRLQARFAPGGLLHYGQGKWYPGESLPRWALTCYWRQDGVPLWEDASLIADEAVDYGHSTTEAQHFITTLAQRLRVDARFVLPAYEDAWHFLQQEQRLPLNVDPLTVDLATAEERTRLARTLGQGLERVVGYVLPLERRRFSPARWVSGAWEFRQGRLCLLPGDSPAGLRLPLDTLPWIAPESYPHMYAHDPFASRGPLPTLPYLSTQAYIPGSSEPRQAGVQEQALPDAATVTAEVSGAAPLSPGTMNGAPMSARRACRARRPMTSARRCVLNRGMGGCMSFPPCVARGLCRPRRCAGRNRHGAPVADRARRLPSACRLPSCPGESDARSGVIEVNIQPAQTWEELVAIVTGLYEDARQT